MQKSSKRKSIRNVLQILAIVAFCAATVALEFVCRVDSVDTLRETMVWKLLQQLCGGMAAILLMIRSNVKLFGKPQKWLYLIPCLIIAIDNFQFSAYFNGKMQLVYNKPADIMLFGAYCLSVGLLEECLFRGLIFGILAGVFPQNRKGFLLTYFVSSLVFGALHIFNGVSGATIMQVGYSVLTGGLFAFCLIKTKNILCCAFVHGLYNFCGLLFGVYDPSTCTIGLGDGIVFDIGTVLTMALVSVIIGAFVLYKVITYSEEERVELYQKVGVKLKKPTKNEGNTAK